MGVAGVALATIIAQGISAVFVLVTLSRSDSCVKLRFKSLSINKDILAKIIKIGIPSGIQMAITSFSNIFVQSYINFFGADCMISFGFGKAIVDNGSAFRFSPVHPKRPLQFLGGSNSSTQTTFYALKDQPYKPMERDAENLSLLNLDYTEQYPDSLRYIASTYDNETGALSESPRATGQKIITFNGILKYEAFPLAAVVKDILDLGTRAMSTPVEIEFAINLNKQPPKLPEFSLLQIRPIAEGNEESDVRANEDEKARNIVYTHMVMGNGNISGIRDVIAIKIEAFRQKEMIDMLLLSILCTDNPHCTTSPRYSPGVLPVVFLNRLLKYAWLPIPTSAPTKPTGSSVEESSSLAFSIRERLR